MRPTEPEVARPPAGPPTSSPVAERLSREGLLGLTEALHSEGPRVSAWTAMRWCRNGLRDGTRLEAIKVGGRWYSSREAVRRFLARQALEPTATANTATRSNTQAVSSYLGSIGLGRAPRGGGA